MVNSILKFLPLVNRAPFESVYDLANLIVNKCLETYYKRSTPYGPMQILDVYEVLVAQVVCQTPCLYLFVLMAKYRPKGTRRFSTSLLWEWQESDLTIRIPNLA